MRALETAGLVATVLVLGGLSVWINHGPIGQRGREIRRQRGGRHTPAWWASIVAIVVLAVVVVVMSLN
ncbi:hypothetical protein GCM10023176_38740 [Micromonospora coerulea]|uniref:Uncharacterized protein n=1 Tax=Micromonospora coerulea TaxID=47856 RepID=A0ABP8SPY7_9ACTN